MKTENYTYKNDNGELITIKNIPSDEVDRIKNSLGCSRGEALYVWCCDEGKIADPEQQDLNEKAKGVKVDVGARSTGKKRTVTRKPDEDKRMLIKALEAFMFSVDGVNDVKVEKVERLITFAFGDDTYKLTLSKDRKAKE